MAEMLEAIILAGGRGERLKSVVSDRPKVMAQVGDHPFLYYLVRQISQTSIRHVVISTGFMKDVIHDYVNRTLAPKFPKIEFELSPEEAPLGTGGGVLQALNKIRGDEVLVINGDSYFQHDLQSFLALHKENQFLLVSKQVENRSRYGSLKLNPQNQVRGFSEKGKSGKGWINGGQYLFSKTMVKGKFKQPCSLEKDILPVLVGEGSVHAAQVEGDFIDIGYPRDYYKAQEFFQKIGEK